MDDLVKEISAQTPDPQRSLKNLERLIRSTPQAFDRHKRQAESIARLFAYSQFLADYSINNPIILGEALKYINKPVTKEEVIAEARKGGFFAEGVRILPPSFKNDTVKFLRDVKKRYLLRITLRDITGATSLDECMAELSMLAEAIVEIALDAAYVLIKERFGELKDNPFTVIALGKLGAGELNYSSDIDIITVYGSEDGLSTGNEGSSGVTINRIGAHEYFVRLTELLANLLQQQNEDGFAYRVDLRLRPDGRRGELSLSLNSYIAYYEAWGKTWERMTLIRAKPVAGDKELGEEFLKAIEPFVWKRSTDYYDIEEIKELKRRIDTVFDANDIKRGYGGIREIEFFVQTFQLLYGGERENLRTPKLAEALARLLDDGFLSEEDIKTLLESYQFYRRLEHVLQMRDDIQTHALPTKAEELETLALKMRFADEKEFSSYLKLRRLKVRDMYWSLLGTGNSEQEVMVFLENELTDDEIKDFLTFKGFKDPNSAINNMKVLSEQMTLGKTIRERTLLRKMLPMFLEHIMKLGNKDRVLNTFVTFIQKVGNHESYLDLFSGRPDTVEIIIKAFSESTYITRSLLSLENIESIFEYPDMHMDYKSAKERLLSILELSRTPKNAVREFRIIEEMRSSLLFLEGIADVDKLTNTLSMLADIIIRAVLNRLDPGAELTIVSLGKLGSRELNIGSDLDLIFVSGKEKSVREKSVRLAEELIKFITKYTARGIVYEVDMRLRPDGSKGILVNDIDGYRNYYRKKAHPWEIQALLKARPITGNGNTLRAFSDMKRDIIAKRGKELTASNIRNMRKRIVAEVSRESSGYDIKLGPGGTEEIEFLVQYLQLKNAAEYPGLVTRKTATALRRLSRHGIIDISVEATLLSAYKFMRTVEALLRLNEERVLKPDSELAGTVAAFFEFSSTDGLVSEIKRTRKQVLDIVEKVYL